jgi:replicative DNA helicase
MRPAPTHRPQDSKFVPPHNLDAEQALLSCILSNNAAYENVRELVAAGDFYHGVLGRLFQAMASTIDKGMRADSITLRHIFQNDEDFKAAGGANYLAMLAGSYVSIINARDYAGTIAELAMRRRLLRVSADIQQVALSSAAPPEGEAPLLAQAEALVYEIGDKKQTTAAMGMAPLFKETLAAIELAHKNQGKMVGVPSGIKALDKKLGGFMPGDFIILAGRPSMGKTVMGLSLARNGASNGYKTLFHSLEMGRQKIMQRLLARETGIATKRQRMGQLNAREFDLLFEAQEKIEALPLWVDETGGLTVPQLRARALRHKRRFGLDLVVVDYLGLMSPARPRPNPEAEVREISNGLKALAKELSVPLIALAQLNREVEKRDDKRPQMSDLRDSGSLEQDADVVILLYRHEYYLVRDEPRQRPNEKSEAFNVRAERWEKDLENSRNKGEAIIAKNRDDETGFVKMHFDGLRGEYRDLDDGVAV